jgi:hypothetical protein
MTRHERHYGLDWLRIGAFALLILYHIGMVFAPWDWVIKTNHRYDALIAPMALLTPWRLALLFAVSGYASRKLLDRSPSSRAFAASRHRRLLIPLAFGMAAIVPIEMWVRVMETGYPHGYLFFWTHDYWRVGSFWGRQFPSWEHLWFVAYLWVYTMLVLGALTLGGPALTRRVERMIKWLARDYRLLWAPACVLIVFKLSLLFVVPEQQGLTTDWSGHAQFLPMFLFGFVLAGAPSLWPALARVAKPALIVAAVSGAVAVAVEMQFPGAEVPSHEVMALDRAARLAMGWSVTIALFHLANRWLNRDHRWRRTIGEAVFPFYIVHHPAIVLIAWYTLPLELPPLAEFAVLLAGTIGACAIVYLAGRELRWVRPLIGLGPKPVPPPIAVEPATT